MKEYITSNRRKIIFQLKWISIILTNAWIIYIFVQYNKGVTIDLITIILGFINATILLPLFTEFMLVMESFIAFSRCNKIINTEPFNQLAKLGFTKTYTDKKTNWSTSMPLLVGQVDKYPMRIEVENSVVRIIADINLDKVEKEHIAQLKQFFGDKNIEYDWFGLAIVYNQARRKDLTIQCLESDIRHFIKYFKTNKLESWDINCNAK